MVPYLKGGDVEKLIKKDECKLFVAYPLLKKEKPKMSKMMKFHKLLSASSESQDPYLQALRAFTKINPARLAATTSDLGWQDW